MNEFAEPTKIDQHVGEQVRARRHKLGMSQATLGTKVGCSFQQIQKYERGANRISASMLFLIANALAVPVGFFYSGLPEEVRAESPEEARLRSFKISRLGNDLLDVAAVLPATVVSGFIVAMAAVAGQFEEPLARPRPRAVAG